MKTVKHLKAFILIFSSLFFLTQLSAQEEAQDTDLSDDFNTEATTPEEPVSYSADFVLQFEPGFYLNTESTLISGPSPIIYPISIGFLWPDSGVIAVQPTISFFMMNHLLYDESHPQ